MKCDANRKRKPRSPNRQPPRLAASVPVSIYLCGGSSESKRRLMKLFLYLVNVFDSKLLQGKVHHRQVATSRRRCHGHTYGTHISSQHYFKYYPSLSVSDDLYLLAFNSIYLFLLILYYNSPSPF